LKNACAQERQNRSAGLELTSAEARSSSAGQHSGKTVTLKTTALLA